MRRLWLIFAQAVTVCLAILFVVTTLRPDWLRLAGPGQPAATRATVDSYAPAVAHAAPSVVNIYTTKHVDVPLLPLPDDPALRQLFGQIPGLSRRESSNSLGSGVIVSPQGYVLTNFHVVEAADAIEVALADGRQAAAKVVGADTETDLAVLKLAGQLDPLPVASYAEGRNLRVGDVVLAIGNPYGVGQTTTQGIVSALGRNGLGINTYENFIQTDAAINPGNSGGALIDTQGNLVGINTAIYSETGGSLGIGFAIPIDAARRVMDEIIKTGKVRRGWLGIEPQDLTPELARAFRLDASASGVIIAGILRGGPADQAGLRVGDIVQALNGQPARNTVTLLGQIAAVTPGQSAVLRVLRAGKTLDIKVTMGTRPARPK
ncbi:trypsin-like peptidase domain-containing protein [Bordetella hinzii]|uniref:2-alkenal reductase n=1 Tax=Bordetella hinzii TaxID=103855 RepID=A0AAN1RVL1_9BORD|nr:trypsin-like peptidase domain-containing protein [Bordetella hinzii]AKQ57779.1 Periplasmic pH-dependent serine endoprotease DegQ precursor [Bordetella hinzii]AKQ62245.1 Periplasmic pH-dependent serine endoprotease DegQ precursor [Bordetella hinzii]AZW16854.1 2-alkenal reductase [Bordetella hinzii]KCB28102.1 putative periplasmic serine peptidase DegS [Bordetella hinzii CA90 BAL1384]KCB44512.1 putative periplasmic serine peptidase DegS [Bordetella hinzii 4161]